VSTTVVFCDCNKEIKNFEYASYYRKIGYCPDCVPQEFVCQTCKKILPICRGHSKRWVKSRKTIDERIEKGELIRCKGINKDGMQCKVYVDYKKVYCGTHLETTTRRFTGQILKSSDYEDYLKSELWRQRRNEKVKDQPFCSLCHRGNGYGIHVHHNNYSRLGNELDSDLVVLCKECHNLFHSNYKYNSEWNCHMPRNGVIHATR